MNEQQLIALMGQHGIKLTANRIIVAKALAEEHRPLSMSELEDRIGSIDKSGIFRTLTLFKEQHLVHVLEDSEGTRYELCHSGNHAVDNDMHVHFHCEHCGETICLEDIPIPPVDLPKGYEAQSANFVLKGLCPHCQKYRE
ncbi:MAG: transcriptional repressor [Bacteroidales bacterium]|nr:transcriptional repressor [Bacteroidales bacterium]